MGYIDKDGIATISARLTERGRELLAKGLLNFTFYKLGDSEIDYASLGTTYDISNTNIFKSVAKQPDLKYEIKPTATSTSNTQSIGTLRPINLTTATQAETVGFFDSTSITGGTEYSALTTLSYIVQDGAEISLTDMNGTNSVDVSQSGSYSFLNEPQIGDIMVVKMSNPDLSLTQVEGVVDLNIPVPYLFFKIENKTGDLSGGTTTLTIDRNLPDFSSYVTSNVAQVTFLPSNTESQFDSGSYSGGTVWNMNNSFSQDIAGINPSTHEDYLDYGSINYNGTKEYFGYTSEMSSKKSVSIIHYTNNDSCVLNPEVKYKQKFYVDTNSSETPILQLPHIMWHKVVFSGGSGTGDVIGQSFSAKGVEKLVTEEGVNSTIPYYDLTDESENVVGRLFHTLKAFSIHDEELVAALSYKSNRNWTLPTLEGSVRTNGNGLFSRTEDVYVTYLFNSNSGYTTGLHCQNYTKITTTDSTKKDVELSFPSDELPFMTVTGGTGWYADEFKVLVQKVTSGNLPEPDSWKEIDMTSLISGHVSGRIDPKNLESSSFIITKSLYDAAITYELNNYITIPTILEPNKLQFGDEKYLYGNIDAKGALTKFRTKFVFTLPASLFNYTENPTWEGSGQNVHLSEVGIYDNTNGLVAIGKLGVPIKKSKSNTITVEVAIDF